MSSSRSEENVNLRHFATQVGATVLVSPAILLDSWLFVVVADVLATIVSHYDVIWQMLLPYCHVNATFVICLADVVALLHWWLWWMVMFLPSGWCYCLVGLWFNHNCGWWYYHNNNSCTRSVPLMFSLFGWCYCKNGWCYCHLEVIGKCYCHVPDVIATCLFVCLIGWCYCHHCSDVGRCYCLEADGIAYCRCGWQMK